RSTSQIYLIQSVIITLGCFTPIERISRYIDLDIRRSTQSTCDATQDGLGTIAIQGSAHDRANIYFFLGIGPPRVCPIYVPADGVDGQIIKVSRMIRVRLKARAVYQGVYNTAVESVSKNGIAYGLFFMDRTNPVDVPLLCMGGA